MLGKSALWVMMCWKLKVCPSQAVINSMTKSNLGKKVFISLCDLQSITKGSHDGNWRQKQSEAKEESSYWLAQLTHFLIYPKTTPY